MLSDFCIKIDVGQIIFDWSINLEIVWVQCLRFWKTIYETGLLSFILFLFFVGSMIDQCQSSTTTALFSNQRDSIFVLWIHGKYYVIKRSDVIDLYLEKQIPLFRESVEETKILLRGIDKCSGPWCKGLRVPWTTGFGNNISLFQL